MKINSRKVLICTSLSFLFSAIIGGSCMILKVYKYVNYTKKIQENLPYNFREELPLLIDSNGYFYIKANINQQYIMDFIIDTKAMSMVKKENLEKYHASYWGKMSFSTSDIYGQSSNIKLFSFDDVRIQSLSFGKSLFSEVLPTNTYIYGLLKDGDKNILGTNILSLLFWKFSVDEDKLVLFCKKDTSLIKKELEGYFKIENGLQDNKINLSFPSMHIEDKFTLDLGYNGEIEINQKTFDSLSQYYSYTTRIGINTDTIHTFSGVDVQWNNFLVLDCKVVYNTLTNKNFIGSKFIRQFNFVLAYGDRIGHTSQQHLYIMPTKKQYRIMNHN